MSDEAQQPDEPESNEQQERLESVQQFQEWLEMVDARPSEHKYHESLRLTECYTCEGWGPARLSDLRNLVAYVRGLEEQITTLLGVDPAGVGEVLERWDQTEPELQRKIVLRFCQRLNECTTSRHNISVIAHGALQALRLLMSGKERPGPKLAALIQQFETVLEQETGA